MFLLNFWMLCLLNALLVTCLAYKFNEEKQTSLEKIKRYVKRQVTGNCYHQICNDTEGYPTEEIEKIVEGSEVFKVLHGNVVGPQIEIESRDFNDEENLCETVSMILRPTKAVDMDGNLQTIVNIEQFPQFIHIHDCIAGGECFAQEFMPTGYSTSCQTQTIVIRMVVVTKESKLKLANFPVPVGCFCKYQFLVRSLDH